MLSHLAQCLDFQNKREIGKEKKKKKRRSCHLVIKEN
jgi:hypothetical protein